MHTAKPTRVSFDFTIGVSLRKALNAVNLVQNDKNKGTLIERVTAESGVMAGAAVSGDTNGTNRLVIVKGVQAAKKLSISPSNSGSGRLTQSQRRALRTGAAPSADIGIAARLLRGVMKGPAAFVAGVVPGPPNPKPSPPRQLSMAGQCRVPTPSARPAYYAQTPNT
jgi:hypothetical protein